MLRLLYALLVGIVGAGIVHIVVLLLVPSYSERDAWSRLSEMADLYGIAPLDAAACVPAPARAYRAASSGPAARTHPTTAP